MLLLLLLLMMMAWPAECRLLQKLLKLMRLRDDLSCQIWSLYVKRYEPTEG